MRRIGLGLLGLGTVGSGVVALLQRHGEVLQQRVGAELQLVRIADVDLERPRPVRVDRALLTARAEQVLDDPRVEVVIELIGGLEPARSYVLRALRNGKHVVTANKALLAAHGPELLEAAAQAGRLLRFEASAGGAIPIVRAIREGLVADRVRSMLGILNGTTNFILTAMSEEGWDFERALREAQRQGYAEADPSLDLEGWDAAHKLCVLGMLAHGAWLDPGRLPVEGIRGVEAMDIAFARELGYEVKLLAICKRTEDGLEARVHPALIPRVHPLAQVRGPFNAIFVEAEAAGQLMFYGPGAGMMPTAAAVLSDVAEVARLLLQDGRPAEALRVHPLAPRNVEELRARYYLRLLALDRPGVLSQISGVLGRHGISIASVIQRGRREQGAVPIFMLTHEAREGDMRRALSELNALEVVTDRTLLLRLEE